jgi:hypothetical protein
MSKGQIVEHMEGCAIIVFHIFDREIAVDDDIPLGIYTEFCGRFGA